MRGIIWLKPALTGRPGKPKLQGKPKAPLEKGTFLGLG